MSYLHRPLDHPAICRPRRPIRKTPMADITVYTKPACVQCNMTKKALDKLGLDYDLVDVTEDQDAFDKIVGMGFMAAPVVISGDASWAGFQPEKINALALPAAA